jgi:pilus assembly protein CpaC
MHPKLSRRLAWGIALAAGLFATAAYAQQPTAPTPPKAKVDQKSNTVIVPIGGEVEFDPGLGPIDEVAVDKADFLDARVLEKDPTKIRLFGRASGLVRLTVTVKKDQKRYYNVLVQLDVEQLRYLIRRTVPTATVEVTAGIGSVVILSGYVTSPQDANIIERLANSAVGGQPNAVINALQVGGVQQVQIDVVVASVDRNEIRTRGFDFFINSRSFQFSSLVSGLIGAQVLGTGTPASLTPSPNANLQFAVVPTQFFGALQALRTEGVAKFLAEPKVVTQTGRPAFFLAGGRQAVLSASSGINGPGVTFEQIGVQLEVLPIVYANGQIWLEVNPTNRQVNQGLGITTVFGAVPGFTEQNVRCAVLLESGQTFAIGGLIQNSVQAASAKVPVLGDLPYVGVAFSQIRHEERESELVVLVTPRLVHPLDCSQVPKRLPGRETRAPDDYELFLENVLEAPRGQRKVWNGKVYNAPYKCDPTIGTYPCVGNLCTGPNLGGTNCGPNGYATPGAQQPQLMPGRDPAAPPAPLPSTVPQTLPGNTVGSADPTASTLPVSQPVGVPEGR